VDSQTADVVILTAIKPELLAARGGFPNAERSKARDGTVYWHASEHSYLTDCSYRIALCCIGGAGTSSAAAASVSAIVTYRPQLVILLGIAAGIRNKTRIGEVVISDRVVAYEPAALVVQDGVAVEQPRPEMQRPAHRIWQDVVNYHPPPNRLRQTFMDLGGKFPAPQAGQEREFEQHVCRDISFHGATIASGNKLLRSPAKLYELRELHGKIEVAEMEAAGLAEACWNQDALWLVIRGISDFGDELKSDDFHQFASSSAAAVVVDFVRYGLELRPSSSVIREETPGNESSPSSSSHGSRSPQCASELRVPQFHYGGVVPPEYFIDRVDELETAERIVRSRQSFLLVGETRAGKTSFCEALIHRVMGRPGNDVLVGKLNLESCQNLTLNTFLGHTLLNMIGETARQVFGCHYSALLVAESPAKQRLSGDAAFRSLMNVHRLVIERIRIKHDAPASSLLPQEFVSFTAELLDLIACRGWGNYLMIYDEANHLARDLSIDLLMNNLEVLNTAHLTTAYAASPAMEASFEPLSAYLPRKVHLGPFESVVEMRQLLGRYYYDDVSRTEDLPITEEAERLVWDISLGTPFRIQCLFAYGFASARRAHELRLTSHLVRLAWLKLQKELPQYFSKP
jgi:nucleoside phosphorylase